MLHVTPWRALLAAFVLALLLSAPPAFATDPAAFAALRLDRLPKPLELPDLSMLDLHGKTMALRSLKDRVVLLNFWTTW